MRCRTAAGPHCPGTALPAPPPALGKKDLVERLLGAKEQSGKTFTQIAKEVGLTNIYTAQLFYHQVGILWTFKCEANMPKGHGIERANAHV